MIEEGMVIKNFEGLQVTVEAPIKGRYGLLLIGTWEGGGQWSTYCPFELPPSKATWPENPNWYGWANRSFITLPNGLKLGDVCFIGQTLSISDCDAEWERTIEAIRKEEQDEMSKTPFL